jgi:hypothetical protein
MDHIVSRASAEIGTAGFVNILKYFSSVPIIKVLLAVLVLFALTYGLIAVEVYSSTMSPVIEPYSR